jgi:drug/metabolite transporter (DMT)-like permease
MELVPLLIVLLSAVGHAQWNFLAKQSRNKLVFIWALYALSPVLYLPLALWIGLDGRIGAAGWASIVGSGAAKAVYIIFLAEALTAGDLSVAYPLSRIAPAIVPVLAVVFLGERLALLGVAGIACVCAAIFVIHLEGFGTAHLARLGGAMRTRGTAFALLTALAVSAYSIIDKYAVSACGVEPFTFNYVHWCVTVVLLAPYVVWRLGGRVVADAFRAEWLPMGLAALLDFGAYTLVLFVLERSKVSYVVAVRQMSQIVAIVLGTVVLKERCGGIRLVAGALILLGVALIGLTR